ncbi:MAG TPA: AMP-binding protein [Pseudonocardiaceae bacterium]|nr:AMP-binding protein [Pseudonocardiaceae bacterium]
MTGPLLHELAGRAAARFGHAPAVSHGGTTLHHGQVHELSVRLSGGLARRGVRRGDRVVVTSSATAELPALLYAVSRLGAMFAVVHEQVRKAALRHVLTDCTPRLLVTDDPSAAGTAAGCSVPVARIADLAASGGAPEPARPLAVDPVCLLYTSGTTALPKAVVSTHAQVAFAAEAIQSCLRYRADDVVYCPLPPSFDYGLYQLFLGALGGSHVWLGRPAESGPGLLANLLRANATVLPAVPPVAEGLLRLLRRNPLRVPPLRLLTNTGATMPAPVLAGLRDLIPGLRVQLMFGLTECKRVSIMEPDGDLARPGALGRPLPGTEVLVVDGDGRPLRPGEVGELVIRGPHVMAGYWRRPELTERRFRRVDGLFPQLHSGDYGWLDQDGYLYFAGRRDDIYKQSGFRVSTIEVEQACRRLPGVDAAAVLPPGPGRPAAVLFVCGAVEPARVLHELRGQLEDFKVPGRCLTVAGLPVTANGKVDRAALTALLEEHTGV